MQREAAERGLSRAVDDFVAAGRTPAAYRELAVEAHAVVELDPRIAADVERRLVALALFPVNQVANDAVNAQAESLALTVWPTLLASPPPRSGESASAYLERLCHEQEVLACRTIVPEFRAHVVAARAAEHALARMKQAITDCAQCSDDGWREIRRGWESAVRSADAALVEVQHRSQLQTWPTAGAGAVLDNRAPDVEIEIAENEIVFDGYRYDNSFRVPVLRDLRTRGTVVFYVHPDAPLRRLTSLLRDARDAGLSTITLIARESAPPWGRKSYALSTSADVRVDVDAPVHAFLRRVDASSQQVASLR
jgi:hypothetical protein